MKSWRNTPPAKPAGTIGDLPKMDSTLELNEKFGTLPFEKAFKALSADQNGLFDALFAVRAKAAGKKAA